MPSYHDVIVFVDGKQYKIIDNYAYELTCTRVGGWRLWHTWDGKSTLIGGEYDGGDFRIAIDGIVICGTPTDNDEWGKVGMTDFGAVVCDVNIEQPDELSFVDEDIRELFKGCCYVMGMPLMAQLIKELRLVRQARLGDEDEPGPEGRPEDRAFEEAWAEQQQRLWRGAEENRET